MFYRLWKTGAQFYLLGPNVERVPATLTTRLNCSFVKSSFQTVASDVIFERPIPTKEAALLRTLSELHGPTIVYCATRKQASNVARLVAEKAGASKTPKRLEGTVEWLKSNYDGSWTLAAGLSRGVGLHHGAIPRAVAQMVVNAFNQGDIRVLVCTSTLIEGVNTQAKNIVLYENRVAKDEIDFFTFNNIKGRSGRMFRHFVGRVVVFSEPPQLKLPFVDVPFISQSPDVPLEILLQLDDVDLSPSSRRAVEAVGDVHELPVDVVRANSGVSPYVQSSIARDLRSRWRSYEGSLGWRGVPRWDPLVATCDVLWRHILKPKPGTAPVTSHKQLAWKLEWIRKNGGYSSLVKKEITDRRPKETEDIAVERALDFARNWAGFRVPKALLTLESIFNQVAKEQKSSVRASYNYYAETISALGEDPLVLALEEYGLPFEIGQRLVRHWPRGTTLDQALERVKTLNLDQLRLAPFELHALQLLRASLGAAQRE